MLIFHNKNKWFGKYPSCDFLNYALQELLENPQENSKTIRYICLAISKADGYFYEDVSNKLKENGFYYRP